MTREEFKILGEYLMKLWPAFAPTAEQRDVWFKALAPYQAAGVRDALDKAFTSTRWREPALADVLEAIRDVKRTAPPVPRQQTPEDEAMAQKIIAEDLERKKKAAGTPAPAPRTRERLSVEADLLLTQVREARSELAHLQASTDAIHAQADNQQKFIDAMRKQLAELERQQSTLALEMKAAAFSEAKL